MGGAHGSATLRGPRWAAFLLLAAPLQAAALRRTVPGEDARTSLVPGVPPPAAMAATLTSGFSDFNGSALDSGYVPSESLEGYNGEGGVGTKAGAVTMDLNVFVPSAFNATGANASSNATVGNQTKKVLTAKHFAHTFSTGELDALHYSQAHGWARANEMKMGMCSPENTVFDFGYYDGADAQAYLEGGFCVVGVEADPTLVQQAVANHAVWLATGQLQLANVAIAPSAETAKYTTFYMSKCTKEWNSFVPTVGCRSCQPPHKQDMAACNQVPLQSVDCLGIFQMFGRPLYLKLDIEGAEPGCFAALASHVGWSYRPQFISAEITQVEYVDQLHHLGYKNFKLVRQDRLHTGHSSRSGPWGYNALDCRAGSAWRGYAEVRAEMEAIISKGFTLDDPCPGGMCTIHGDGGCKGTTYIWYDIHATW